ncbi:MAG: MBL fold metallo-hydrolase [Elusimicrobia bacterium]|nr:MBL fold metallo-hydrolase [Elusimicrobiota bacterium]
MRYGVPGRVVRRIIEGLVLFILAWSPSAVSASETIESLASQDHLAGLTIRSFLGPDNRGMVISRPGGVEISVPGPEASASGSMSVFFVNVGQGDAEYIELPNGKNALIDAGPAGRASGSGNAAPPIAEFLASRGVTRIDHVVLTHPHADHYGGLGWVFDNLQVGKFYDTGIDNSGATGDDAVRRKAAEEPDCATEHPAADDSLDWAPGVGVKVLNSCPEPSLSSSGGKDINDCSIVLKMSYGGTSLLFTGDIQSRAEAELVARYGDELRSDVLKVGHHGSAQSSTAAFLDKVRPKLAFIEVGKNSYGHPTPAALTRLASVGAQAHRTDRDGTGEFARRAEPERPVAVASAGGVSFPGR